MANEKPDDKVKRRKRGGLLRGTVNVALLGAIAAGVILVALAIHKRSAEAQAAQQSALVTRAVPVSVARPAAESGYDLTRSFTGLVAARRSVDLGFDQAGRVMAVHADLGDRVAQGEVVAELDRDRLLARQAELTASIAEARAALALAEGDLGRAVRLTASGATAAVTRDQAQSARDRAAARLASAEAALANVAIDLDLAALRAPFEATVVARLAEPGAVVSPGTPILRLLDAVSLEVQVGLPLTEARRLSVGQTVMLRLRQAQVAGTVRTVVPEIAGGTRTATVIVALPPGAEVTEGETVDLVITNRVDAEGYWVPTAALMPGVRGLWALRTVVVDPQSGDGTVADAAVSILHAADGRAFVRGTLDADTPVIIDGAHRVAPGQTVSIQPTSEGEGL
ncbi:efflux RND transporter periplasmic adaptor subunit (plasmid) [Tabrizicola piscis]|uniref:Efflux RND transporter periplasmic adaptor subunit n=1 Tax=Tabrizicola piscis TaxID=2494374 RepID=A0A3S8UCV5_9RHOB|nr:efflux RND transporter periplasmic adaptor subunit [Tabrizicola piscis]AZL61436.1 efflux RND transporter periplasmic adaptor subunit [Tabrizicola piscis]